MKPRKKGVKCAKVGGGDLPISTLILAIGGRGVEMDKSERGRERGRGGHGDWLKQYSVDVCLHKVALSLKKPVKERTKGTRGCRNGPGKREGDGQEGSTSGGDPSRGAFNGLVKKEGIRYLVEGVDTGVFRRELPSAILMSSLWGANKGRKVINMCPTSMGRGEKE